MRRMAHAAAKPTPSPPRPDRDLLHEQADHVEQAVARLLDPVDEPEHEQDRDRIVEPGLRLQRAGQPAPEGGGAQQGEDGRAVRGGQDRSQQEPSRVDRSKSQMAANAVITAVPSVANTASINPGRSTGLISEKPATSPPSKRMAARAMIPPCGPARSRRA